MTKSSVQGAVLGVLARGVGIGGGVLLFGEVDTRPVRHDDRGAQLISSDEAATSEGVDGDHPTAVGERSAELVRAPAPSEAEVAAARDGVEKTLTELRELYGYAGALDTEAARALIAKRRAATDVLVRRLVAYGAAGVNPTIDAYASAETGREKLLLIEALGANPSTAAAEGLSGLLAGESAFSYRRAMVEALGESLAPNADGILAGIATTADDPRTRTAAIKSLAAGPDATAALMARVDADPDVDVRIAALTRLSELGGDGAEAALGRVAGQPEAGTRVRAAAIVGLARAFPGGAVEVLTPLVGDEQPAVRAAVVTALERVRSEAAAALLRDIAARDSEASVRARAEQALARMAL